MVKLNTGLKLAALIHLTQTETNKSTRRRKSIEKEICQLLDMGRGEN